MDFYLLIFGGMVIGFIGTALGGGLFLSVPFLQFLFPTVNYGSLMGNIRLGSFFRSIASTISTLSQIEWRKFLGISILYALSAVGAVSLVSALSQEYIFYAIILAILMSELAPKFARVINKKTRIFMSLFLGFYVGLIGAGISIMLVALFRTAYPDENKIMYVKIQARFMEFVGLLAMILTHIIYGNLILKIWLPFSIGSLVGGFCGGIFLKKGTKFSIKTQKVFLYLMYGVALAPYLIGYLF